MASVLDLSVGDVAQIIGYEKKDKAYRQKILSMGLTKGTEFVLTQTAPLGDPLEIKVRNYKLSLRKAEASVLIVKKIEKNE